MRFVALRPPASTERVFDCRSDGIAALNPSYEPERLLAFAPARHFWKAAQSGRAHHFSFADLPNERLPTWTRNATPPTAITISHRSAGRHARWRKPATARSPTRPTNRRRRMARTKPPIKVEG